MYKMIDKTHETFNALLDKWDDKAKDSDSEIEKETLSECKIDLRLFYCDVIMPLLKKIHQITRANTIKAKVINHD